MCPQSPRLSPEYSHKAGLQTVITGGPLQIRPVTRDGHTGPVTMGRTTRGPPCWTRSQDETTSSQVFVRWHMRRRVSLPVVLSPLVQRGRRRPRAKGGVFAFAPTGARLRGETSPEARARSHRGSGDAGKGTGMFGMTQGVQSWAQHRCKGIREWRSTAG
jgi:hypothetical protein